MLKPTLPLAILVTLLSASVLTSIGSYRSTKQCVEMDMQQALTLTLQERRCDVITADTIRTFNYHLRLPELRGRATLAIACPTGCDSVATTLSPHCPTLTIWRLSDQRPSLALASMAFVWAIGCGIRRQRPSVNRATFGGLSTDGRHRFFNERQEEIKFTPMQQQLMEMFFQAEDHRLSKTEICETLWPKKDDASETLYTLIRRLKTVLKAESRLTIESDRGRDYRLTINDLN